MMSSGKGEIEPATEPATEITGAGAGAAPTDQNKTENKEKKETPSDNTPAPPNQAVEPTEEKADSTAEEKKSTAPKPKPPKGDGDNDNDAQKKKEEEDRPARGMEDLLNKQNKESFKDAKKAVAETDTAKSVHGVLNAAYNNASGTDPSKKTDDADKSKKTESVAQSAGKAAMTMGADTTKSAAMAVRDMARQFSQKPSRVAPEPKEEPSSEDNNTPKK